MVKNNNLHVTPVLLNYSGWCQAVKSSGELTLKISGYIVKIFKQYQASESGVNHRTNKYRNIYMYK
jgi:hypothetical protein